jgi:hypothetical protein
VDNFLAIQNFFFNPVAAMLGEARWPVPDMITNKIVVGDLGGWKILRKVVVDSRDNLNEMSI